jgi:hypothetical protein
VVRIIELKALEALQPGFDGESIVITNRRAVSAVSLNDRQANALILKISEPKPQSLEVFEASDLKPMQIIGMVGYAHLIGLDVTDAHLRFVDKHAAIL